MKLPYAYRGLVMTVSLLLLLPAAAWRYALRDTVRAAAECLRMRDITAAMPEHTGIGATPPAAFGDDIVSSGRILDYARQDAAITGYAPVVTERQGTTALHTAEIEFTGEFAETLRALHRIETEATQCAVRAAAWRIKARRAPQSEQLTLTIHVEQLVKNENP